MKPILLQDQVSDYMERGLSLVPLKRYEKVPLTDALPRFRGRPNRALYQTQAATPENVARWFADHDELNIGLVTGYKCPQALSRESSYTSFYALDIDVPGIPQQLEACHTTTVQTARGHHLYFVGPDRLLSRNVTVDGTPCEFKGMGLYVAAPVSVHPNGTTYTFVRGQGLNAIKPLPDFLLEMLETGKPEIKEKPHMGKPRGNGPNPRGRACIRQIWERAIVEGERDKSLFILYQMLISANHEEEYARLFMERKNQSLSVPLPDSEVRRIVSYGPAADRKGHSCGVGCNFVRTNGPAWIDCAGCSYANRRATQLIDAREFDRAISELRSDPSAAYVYMALLKAERTTGVRSLTPREIEDRTGLCRHTVLDALQELREKGFLKP